MQKLQQSAATLLKLSVYVASMSVENEQEISYVCMYHLPAVKYFLLIQSRDT